MKKVLIVVLFSLLLGGGFAFFIFYKIRMEDVSVSEVVVTAFQVGAFNSYDNAYRVAIRNNGIVVSDEDIFRVYVSVLYDEEAISKLSLYYDSIGLNYYLKSISVSKKFVDSIKDNEELLVRSSSDTFSVINKSILNRFEEVL
jgi:hypothetical protein